MARTLTLPLAVGAQGLATRTQGSPAELSQSVGLLLATDPGERRSVPGYGYDSALFAQLGPTGPVGARFTADDAGIGAAIAEWEPRADPATVELTADGNQLQVTVHPAAADLDPDDDLQEDA